GGHTRDQPRQRREGHAAVVAGQQRRTGEGQGDAAVVVNDLVNGVEAYGVGGGGQVRPEDGEANRAPFVRDAEDFDSAVAFAAGRARTKVAKDAVGIKAAFEYFGVARIVGVRIGWRARRRGPRG